MSPAVADIISKATAGAQCAWPLAGMVYASFVAGKLYRRTDEYVARYGREAFDDACWTCGFWLEAEASE